MSKIKYLLVLLLLAGCTTANLVMKVDPTLESNATVYEVETPKAISNDSLNVSFGPYRVADAHASWTRTGDSRAQGSLWLDILYEFTGLTTHDSTKREETPPFTITGPTSVHDTKSYVSQSLTYNFKVRDDITWHSKCDFNAEKNISKTGDQITNVQTLSSNFTCSYTKADDEPYNEQWTLVIEKYGISQLHINLTGHGEGKNFIAHSTAGTYDLSDGSSPNKIFRPGDPGYTWKENNNIVGAVSVNVKVPRVWLDNRNPDSINDVLAMGSTGLLIYKRRIASMAE